MDKAIFEIEQMKVHKIKNVILLKELFHPNVFSLSLWKRELWKVHFILLPRFYFLNPTFWTAKWRFCSKLFAQYTYWQFCSFLCQIACSLIRGTENKFTFLIQKSFCENRRFWNIQEKLKYLSFFHQCSLFWWGNYSTSKNITSFDIKF